ncbi:TPA: asparagine synthase (glutamine-hydrolyzing), partial [Candidatus Poribacteria bacterium]|nr:asparagine synthase (glutamine-hydrolyzing) [Candidatus Poribacteria bacterium]
MYELKGMCGIAGYYGEFPIKVQRIQRCLKLMHRRGPDHADFFQHTNAKSRHVYLLSSRLSILDLEERSNQPFRLGSKALVYNGELYNYLELKQKLIAQNKKFLTKSDTEVLLQVLTTLGWKGLDHCEGMWAFAMYDENDGSLLLSRDRFGEKPLYVYRDQTGLYFGSEVKFIFSLLGRRLDINRNHLYRYMINGYKSLYKGSETFFHGLEELPPASVFQIDSSGGETKEHYWEPALEQDEALSYQDVLEGARRALIQSVHLRLRSDVPLAFCMSGGIDSNALIHIAKKELDYDVHAFTIVNT